MDGYLETILNEIPSVLLRDYLKENLPQWTLLQWASVASIEPAALGFDGVPDFCVGSRYLF